MSRFSNTAWAHRPRRRDVRAEPGWQFRARVRTTAISLCIVFGAFVAAHVAAKAIANLAHFNVTFGG